MIVDSWLMRFTRYGRSPHALEQRLSYYFAPVRVSREDVARGSPTSKHSDQLASTRNRYFDLARPDFDIRNVDHRKRMFSF